MKKSNVLLVLLLVGMLLVSSFPSALAQEAQPPLMPNEMLPNVGMEYTLPDSGTASAAASCALAATDPDQMVTAIAEIAQTELRDSKSIRACYDALSIEQKALVFERSATKRSHNDKSGRKDSDIGPQAVQPLAFGTLLTPYTAIGWGESRTAYMYWMDNGNRCPIERGPETNFAYSYSTNVTNPAGLRANSPTHLLVDSAIAYYTVKYGGLKTWYDTNSNVITTCVGNEGLSKVGGAEVWKAHARIYKP